MSFESDLYSKLVAAAGLNAIVGSRISPSHDEKPSSPYVVYTTVFGEAFYSLAGASTQTRTRVQIDCYAEDPDTAADIAREVISAIPESGALHRASHSNHDLGREVETSLYRRMVEMSIFHRSS